MPPLDIAIIGAGGRGAGFAKTISKFPRLGRVAAVAEPRAAYRERIATDYQLATDRVFETWQQFVEAGKICDAVVIATMDQDHVDPAVRCTGLGYDMLLEKPMAVTLEDCRAIADAQSRAETITSVCHSLRYNKGFAKLKEIAASGRLGRLITLDQIEQVGWWHQAHSFVRGNWGNESRSTFMLLAKSCHDIDYIAYLLDEPCQSVGSYGALTYFTRENAPENSGERCVECALEPECPYSAIRHYVHGDRETWPAAAIAPEHSRQAHYDAIATGPYGKCVWKTDNDVVDHQVVMMQFARDVTATFTMTAFTQHGGRKIRLHGTRADALLQEGTIQVRDFDTNNTETIEIGEETGGHGGGDRRVVLSWLRAMHNEDPTLVVSDVHESLRTHSIVFAAETARRENRMVDMQEIYGG